MRLDLTEVAINLGKRIRYEIDEPPMEELGSGIRSVERITGEAVFSNTGSNIVVRGSFRTAVELECGRCLESYRIEIEQPIEEELPISGRPAWADEDEDEAEVSEEEKEPLFVDNIFDLEELLRQSILVAVPIKPLCSDACKGLCAHCGVNLNTGSCECPAETEESPFVVLASLMKEEEPEE